MLTVKSCFIVSALAYYFNLSRDRNIFFSHMRCLQESGVSCEYSLGTLTDTRTAVLNRTFIPEKSI